jgi:hypothetical protein
VPSSCSACACACAQVPAILLLSLCAGVPAAYPIGNFPIEGLPRFWTVYFAMLMTTECMAQAFALQADPLMGLLNFMNVWFMAFLFNGISVPVDAVIWPFRVFTYSTPYRYGFSALSHVAFIETPTYSGAEPCRAPTPWPIPWPAQLPGDGPPWPAYCITTCPDSQGRGYYCPELPPIACYGRTGKQILTALGATFKSVEAGDVWLRYTLYVAVQESR